MRSFDQLSRFYELRYLVKKTGECDEKDFLSLYVVAIKQIAEVEVDHFMKSLGETLNGQEAAELGAEGVNVANQMLTLLHTKFILLNDRAKGAPQNT